MNREGLLEHHTVIVRGDRIREVGPAGKVHIPSRAVIVPGKGRFLMPGLADMHVHLEDEKDALLLFVANGVTTVRNMWGKPQHIEWRSQIESGDRLGPTIYTTGPITDGDPPVWEGSAIVTTPEEAERELLAQMEAGYHGMKIMTNLRPQVYEAILTASKKCGFPVYGHVPTRVGYRKALDMGQRSFEHPQDFVYGLLAGASPLRAAIIEAHDMFLKLRSEQRTDELIKNIRVMATEPHLAVMRADFAPLAKAAAASGAWFCPTVVASAGFHIDRGEFDALRQLPQNRYVPADRRRRWDRSLEWQLSNRTDPEENNLVWDVERRAVQALHRAGAKILAGTDTHPDMPYIVPGFSLHEEVRKLVDVGLSPYEALRAATIEPAAMLGRSEKFGTVTVGSRADLILLEANPLEDVRNAAKRVGVMLRGQWFTDEQLRERLDSLVDSIKAEDKTTDGEREK